VDVTARMPGVLWPRSTLKAFSKQRQLRRFLARMFPEGAPRPPRVDFSRRRLILVAAGPRSSTGYSVRIVSVVERDNGVRVLARELTPSLGDHVVARLTSPYRLITIPAPHKPVYVSWQERR
jgi:PrcB C-terminal